MYPIDDNTPIGVLTVGQFKNLMGEVLSELKANSQGLAIELPKEIMDINELSEYISQSKSHIYKLTGTFKIPYYKRCKKLYFKRSEIDEWLTQDRVKTMDEITTEALNFQLKSR